MASPFFHSLSVLPQNVSKQIREKFGSGTLLPVGGKTPLVPKQSSSLAQPSPKMKNVGEINISSSLKTFLAPAQLELLQDSVQLLQWHKTCGDSAPRFHDYGFVVFPAAKAFEGFLKLYFWRMELITDEEYHGRRWRVGRSFNPDLPQRFRDESWVYDDVGQKCSPALAARIWQVWLEGRNHVVHFFPEDRYELTLVEAEVLVGRIFAVMEEAVECAVKNGV